MAIFSIILIILWLILIYAWIAYPLILVCLISLRTYYFDFQPFGRCCRHFCSKGNKRVHSRVSDFPSVSVIISAYNEEKHIGTRIENLLGLDFCPKKFAIRIGVDGSTDGTAKIAKRWVLSHSCIRVYDFSERRGKIAVLKDLVAKSEEEILVFTDANTVFREDAMRHLLNPFEDSSVGGVCGRLIFRGQEKEGVYWRWETRLKEMESAFDSCLGANGAIYAVRRNLFWQNIPDNTIVDDFVIGMKVREQGYRMIYEPRALAEEDYPSADQEWARRVRIGAGDYQALGLCRRCLLPTYGTFSWIFWSHKVLRWFTPHLLILMVCLSAALYAVPIRNALLILVTLLPIFSGAAAARFLRGFSSIDMNRTFLKPLELCDYFLTMQMALFLGFLRFCRGNLRGYWKRTSRD